MIQDGTSGWHGHKNGLALFYVDQQHFQQEFHETSLTSNMNSYFQLMIKPGLVLKSYADFIVKLLTKYGEP